MTIGIHTAPADGPGRDELLDWVHSQPKAPPVCVVNDVPYGIRLKDAGAWPVFFRTVTSDGSDGRANLTRSVDDMLRLYNDGCQAGLVPVPWCEVGISPSIISRMVTVSEAFWSRQLYCAPGDFQTGIPSEAGYSVYKPLVEAINANRSRAWLTMNQYFAITPYSGMVPLDHVYDWTADAPVPPGAALPSHCGRHRWLWKYLDEQPLPIAHPPLAILEVNSAGLGDIATWEKAQPRNGPCDPGYGWRQCFAAWQQHYPGKDPEQLFADMLIWLDKNIYRPDGVDCVIVYRWSDARNLPDCSQNNWETFSIYGTQIPALLKAYNQSLGVSPVNWQLRTMIVPLKTTVNYRAAATKSSAILETLQPGVYVVSQDRDFDALADGLNWAHIRVHGKDGFIAKQIVALDDLPEPLPETPGELLDWQTVRQAAQTIVNTASNHQ